MSDFVRVASVSDLPPGGVMLVEVDGERVALVNVDGEMYAVAEECTHERCPLSEGDLEGSLLVCPCHGSAFDVTTGRPANPPAFDSACPLRRPRRRRRRAHPPDGVSGAPSRLC